MTRKHKQTVRTDGDVMKLANRMDDLVMALNDLYREICDSDHPNAEYMRERMEDNLIPVIAMPSDVLSDCLLHPEQWNKQNGYYRHAAAAKAWQTRRSGGAHR